ncbi:MAG: cytochrome D ubiquinol oxidase subunit I, partial [Acetobacter sp.]
MAGLDPDDWDTLRTQAHRMLDAMIDNIRAVPAGPVWQPMPPALRQGFDTAPLPEHGRDLAELHARFVQAVQPYSVGNRHPRFMGWVHGGGTVQGMLADMLAAGLNANLGGRNHAPVDVERMVIRWAAAMFGFPATTTGLLV